MLAFCAAPNTDEKKPAGLFGCVGDVNVPPGVLVSSTVGGRGEVIEVESLLGKFADCARRCLMLSTEFKLRAAGDPFCGDVVREEKTEALALGSVGVGGVTTVVGVRRRFGGVEGVDVSMSCRPRCFGVSVRSFFVNDATVSSTGADLASAMSFCDVFAVEELRLFLLLEDLNSPPSPELPPTPAFADSSPPDFLRLRVNVWRSLFA